MHGRIMPLALEMEGKLFASFTDAEQESFRHLLARVREAAGELDPDTMPDTMEDPT
jgi:hypothetical protein